MSDKLQLTKKALDEAPDLKTMFELAPVRHNAVMNLVRTTGVTEEKAAMHYEREKILFFKALQSNKKIESCERFTIYSAWIELMASGLTLNDGHSYIIPYGKQAQFQVGWKGRLEQLSQIPEIVNIPPPQVVYENDEFDYELGDSPKIIKHKPAPSHEGKRLTFVYLVLQKQSGKETHLMNREEVLSIRDRYSQGYKLYMTACAEAKVEPGQPIVKEGKYGPYTIEPPMWITAEPQAWKKTLVKRVYSGIPNKTARMKALDERIKANMDIEDGRHEEQTHDINYGLEEEAPAAQTRQQLPPVKKQETKPVIITEAGTKVDTTTGEEIKEKTAIDEAIGNPEDSF